jgi:hypothetical protein
MDLGESTVHSFIIKLWLEDEGGDTSRLKWHGYITHVPSGARRYFKKLNEITDFIKQYVDGNDARIHRPTRLRDWLRRLMLNPRQG